MQELYLNEALFDLWNNEKKLLNMAHKVIYPKPREIRYIKIWANVGRELFGKRWFFRPVLVVSVIGNMYFALPMTTKWYHEKYYIKVQSVDFKKDSFVVISQWRVFDAQRFFTKIGLMSKEEFKYIKKLLVWSYFPEDS